MNFAWHYMNFAWHYMNFTPVFSVCGVPSYPHVIHDLSNRTFKHIKETRNANKETQKT